MPEEISAAVRKQSWKASGFFGDNNLVQFLWLLLQHRFFSQAPGSPASAWASFVQKSFIIHNWPNFGDMTKDLGALVFFGDGRFQIFKPFELERRSSLGTPRF